MSGGKPRWQNLTMLDYRVWRAFVHNYPEIITKADPPGRPDGGKPFDHMAFFDVISSGLRLSRRYQETMVATIRELRALSKEVGVRAARPLHRASPKAPKPDLGPYGIHILCGEGETCVECGANMPPTGPMGWRRHDDPGPLCDPCLLEVSPTLAAILSAINLLREAGWMECSSDEDEVTIGGMVLTTAWLYEQSEFEGLPLRAIDVETGILPALNRLDAAYGTVESEDEEDTVCH